ncbi:hypothetical protein JFT81_14340 [Pseudomonas sp. TH43]|jgi:hypothetical protein|uniref:hypothetical protein n=1 Tax=Pseudomonas sp. TH43 TaxID=2796407 RepID=UPI001913BA02|nr:hypothetical protein [Pseudomonas sp. TH43]MBK5375814.1 hypothetical protein [Pseudomonas sp. TH43]
MSEFKDKSITEGTRKKTDYENDQKSRLALNVERTDGGKLQIPIMVDAKTTEEEEKYQHNTLLAVTPLARLPGHDKLNETLQGALPRPGRIYVFLKNKLWRELETDGKGQLFEVDVAHWRKVAEKKGDADKRDPVCVKQYLILVPMFLQGRFVGDQLSIAYSELPWTWEYIEWLEKDSGRIKARSQNMRSAWAATAGETQHWKASLIHPATPVKGITKGLRARELHVETLLEDPSLFTPDLTTLPATTIIKQLEKYQQELAGHLNTTPPSPPDALPASTDVLSEYKLRDYPHLVGFIVDDPLFTFRHAVAQCRLAVELLQTLNALVPYQPFGHYAELLYQEVLSPAGSLKDLLPHVDEDGLKKTTLHAEREKAREVVYIQQERMLDLVNKKLPSIWNDYTYSKDERLLEPYALLVELLEILGCSAKKSDPRCIEPDDSKVSAAVLKLSRDLAAATNILTKDLLPTTNGELPATASKLAAFKNTGKEANPENLGLSSLSLFSNLYIGQNVALAVDEVAAHIAHATAAIAKKVAESKNITQVELVRVFGPSFTFANKLSSKAKNLKLITQGEALSQNLVVLGIHGAGLSFGVTPNERTTLTRKNFLVANFEGRNGQIVGTTSGKVAERLSFAKKELGYVMVVAGSADDPIVQEYMRWRMTMPAMASAKNLSSNIALPGIATAFAAFSLYANTVGATSLLSGERTRFFAGAAAAGIDLGLAANNVMLKIIVDSNATRSPWLIFWERGRFDTKNWKFGFGENLSKRTGSSWLNLTRIGSTFAVAATTALFVWDAARAAKQGENDVAMAYSLAAVGSGMWALYTIGLLASPWILGIGVALFVAGLVGSVLLANSPVEQVVKQGPFGDSDRLEHLNDPLIAYQQLLGILGAPRLKIHRLQQWQKESSKDDREKLILSAKNNNISLTPNDWTVELQTPLLSHFETGLRFTIKAKETVRTRQHFSGWNHLPSIDIQKEKLGGIILDGTRILYILASQNNVIAEDDSSRNLRACEYKLKVYGQFELGPFQCNVGDPFPEYRNIALPQPRPSAWVPFPGSMPAENDGTEDVPYWLIEQRDFAKI